MKYEAPQTLTVTEAAEYLGRKIKTLQLWDRKGILKPKRTPTNRRVYTKVQLDEFLGIIPKEIPPKEIPPTEIDLTSNIRLLEEEVIQDILSSIHRFTSRLSP